MSCAANHSAEDTGCTAECSGPMTCLCSTALRQLDHNPMSLQVLEPASHEHAAGLCCSATTCTVLRCICGPSCTTACLLHEGQRCTAAPWPHTKTESHTKNAPQVTPEPHSKLSSATACLLHSRHCLCWMPPDLYPHRPQWQCSSSVALNVARRKARAFIFCVLIKTQLTCCTR